MLTPVLILVAWTLVIWVWMYALRIPAMQAAKVDPDSARHPGSLDMLPSNVRAAADNYNHLHEAPTVFYAIAIYSHLVGVADGFNIICAWAYVGLRIAHSVVQIVSTNVTMRFLLFVLSTSALIIMIVRNLIALAV